MTLREKLNSLDTKNSEKNDLLYAILDELLDRIEALEEKNENKPEVGTKIA